MIPVRFSKDAAKFVRNETEYLRQRNPAAAMKFSQAMKDAKRLLQAFPEAGNRMHGLQIAGGLTLVVGDFLLDYIYKGSRIAVLSIRNGRMLMPTPDTGIDSDLEEALDALPESTKPSF